MSVLKVARLLRWVIHLGSKLVFDFLVSSLSNLTSSADLSRKKLKKVWGSRLYRRYLSLLRFLYELYLSSKSL